MRPAKTPWSYPNNKKAEELAIETITRRAAPRAFHHVRIAIVMIGTAGWKVWVFVELWTAPQIYVEEKHRVEGLYEVLIMFDGHICFYPSKSEFSCLTVGCCKLA
jgi:hypothetical protein